MMPGMDLRADARHRPAVRAALPFAVLALLAVSGGCHKSPPVTDSAPTGRITVVTREEIARMGVRTAWDVVRAKAPRLFEDSPGHLRPQETRSYNAEETPLLVVDDAQTNDLSWLHNIAASEISLIRIMDAEAAEPFYGLRAAAGAIVVVTRSGRQPPM